MEGSRKNIPWRSEETGCVGAWSVEGSVRGSVWQEVGWCWGGTGSRGEIMIYIILKIKGSC